MGQGLGYLGTEIRATLFRNFPECLDLSVKHALNCSIWCIVEITISWAHRDMEMPFCWVRPAPRPLVFLKYIVRFSVWIALHCLIGGRLIECNYFLEWRELVCMQDCLSYLGNVKPGTDCHAIVMLLIKDLYEHYSVNWTRYNWSYFILVMLELVKNDGLS